MQGHRWEGQRSAWIAEKYPRSARARRLADVLDRKARRRQRGAAGVGRSVDTTVLAPSWWARLSSDDSAWVMAGAVAVLLLLAPEAMLVAWAGYALWWAIAPAVRPRWWIPLAAGIAAAAIIYRTGAYEGLWSWWPTKPHPVDPWDLVAGFVAGRLPVTLTLGLLLLAWIIWERGWAAVQIERPARAPRRRPRAAEHPDAPAPELRDTWAEDEDLPTWQT